MINNKHFTVKVYASNGTTFLTTFNASIIKTAPTFTVNINGGYGQCVLDLKLPFTNFGEGGNINYMNIVKIYCADTNNINGRLIYTGFISTYSPYKTAATEGVKITLLGMVSLLSLAYYKSGSSFTVTQTTKDPAAIMKLIIDHFNSVYANSLIKYDVGGTTVNTVGANISYTYTQNKWLDALVNTQKAIATAGWWFSIDKNGVLNLASKPGSATHSFTLGKDVDSITVDKTSENVVNQVEVQYVSSGVYDYNDAASIAIFGTREEIIADTSVTDAPTAQARAQGEVNNMKNGFIKAQITLNINADLENIFVGETCKILNLPASQTLFNNNMQIVSVNYAFDKAIIGLEQMPTFQNQIAALTS